MNTISLALTDDDALIVLLLQEFLDQQESLQVTMTAVSGPELLEKLAVADPLPEVLLLDLKMKDLDGVEISRRLQELYPSVRIIVLTSHYQPSSLGFMLKLGAAAFLPKGMAPQELPAIIATVATTGLYLLPDQVALMRAQLSAKTPPPYTESENSLSAREIDVLRLLCQQKTAKEIGELLFISQSTVEGHKNSLFVKTGVKNIAGLVVYAIQRGIIQVEELPVI